MSNEDLKDLGDEEKASRHSTVEVTKDNSLDAAVPDSEGVQARLAEIKERLEAATPGPWTHMGPTDNERNEGRERHYVARTVGCGDVPPEKFFIAILHANPVFAIQDGGEYAERDVADAEFIANAPSDVEFLLSLVGTRAQHAPADVFTIKPLEWEHNLLSHALIDESYDAAARCGFSARVYRYTSSGWFWTATGIHDKRTCASPEEGKQLAEAHWREYIKQGLVPLEETKSITPS